MHDRFWNDALEHLLTLPTAEERENYRLGYGPQVAGCLRIMLERRIQRSLHEMEQQLTE